MYAWIDCGYTIPYIVCNLHASYEQKCFDWNTLHLHWLLQQNLQLWVYEWVYEWLYSVSKWSNIFSRRAINTSHIYIPVNSIKYSSFASQATVTAIVNIIHTTTPSFTFDHVAKIYNISSTSAVNILRYYPERIEMMFKGSLHVRGYVHSIHIETDDVPRRTW